MKASAERMAINAPIQGTEADIIKLAMIKIDEFLSRKNLKKDVRLLLQVHDELVFEVPESEVAWLKTEVPRIMAGVADLKVPLLAEVGVGANWDQAH